MSQHITELAWAADESADASSGTGRATGAAHIDYPADWSSKNGAAPTPHLSTVDATALSVRLLDAILVSGFGGTTDVSRAWLRRFVIKSGNSPLYDLDHIPLNVTERATAPSQTQAGWWTSTYDCTIGNIAVRCQLEHDGNGIPERRMSSDIPLTAAPYYSAGYQARTHEITDIRIDDDFPSMSATARFVDNAGYLPSRSAVEIGCAYQPSPTFLDVGIVFAQLGQVLAYSLDGFSRNQNGSLWMRRVDMWLDTPHRLFDGPLACAMQMRRSKVVELSGQSWRLSNLAGSCGNFGVAYSVAHRLPGG